MRKLSAFFACSLFIVIAACGGSGDDAGDDDDDPIDAAADPIDADTTPPPDAEEQTTNALGQVCDLANPQCPAGNTCTGIQGVGSTTMGYCSPMCMNMNAICTTGYTGPAGGTPVCALSEAQGSPPSLCAIICTTNEHCGAGLECIPVPGQQQPVSVCAPPA